MKVQCVYTGKCEYTNCPHHEPHEDFSVDCCEDCGGSIKCSDSSRHICSWQIRNISVYCIPVGKKLVKKTKEKEHPMVGTVKKMDKMDRVNACPSTDVCALPSCDHYGPHEPNRTCRIKCTAAGYKTCEQVKNRQASPARAVAAMKKAIKKQVKDRISTYHHTSMAADKKAMDRVVDAHSEFLKSIDERKERVSAPKPDESEFLKSIDEHKERVSAPKPDELAKCTHADDPGCLGHKCTHYGWHTNKYSGCHKPSNCSHIGNIHVKCATKPQFMLAEKEAERIVAGVVNGIMRVVTEHRNTNKISQESQQYNIDSKIAVQVKLQTLPRLPVE